MNENGISFSKEQIKLAFENYDNIVTTSLEYIKNIEDSLSIIETNWSGPEHDLAINDKINAEENLNKAKEMLSNMSNSISQLNINASKVSYDA